MQQGVDKQINLGGIVRNTAGSTCPDGEMEEIINLRYKDGSLRPISDNETVPGLDNVEMEYQYITIHTCGYRHWLGVKDGALWYFADQDDDDRVVMKTSPISLCSVSQQQPKYSQAGNLLTVIDGGGIKYVYWKKGAYILSNIDYNGAQTATTVPPFDISFRVTPVTDSAGHQKIRVYKGENIDFYAFGLNFFYSKKDRKKKCGAFTDEQIKSREDIYKALYLRARNSVWKDGYTYGHYMICAALQTYDGNYVMQSAPIYITCGNDRVRYSGTKKSSSFFTPYEYTTINGKGGIINQDDDYTIRLYNDYATEKNCGERYPNGHYDNGDWDFRCASTAQGSDEDSRCGYQLKYRIGHNDFSKKDKVKDTNSYYEYTLDSDFKKYLESELIIDKNIKYVKQRNTKINRREVEAVKVVVDNGDLKEYYKYITYPNPARLNGSTNSSGLIYDRTNGHFQQNSDYNVKFVRDIDVPPFWGGLCLSPSGSITTMNPHDPRDFIVPNIYDDQQQELHFALNKLQYRINNCSKIDRDLYPKIAIFITRMIDPCDVNRGFKEMNSTLSYPDRKNAYATFRDQTNLYMRDNLDEYTPWAYTPYILRTDEIIESLMNNGESQIFYKIFEASVDNIKASNGWIDLTPKDTFDPEHLYNLDQLNLDAINRSSFVPQVSYTYNGRLHLANYYENKFNGWPIHSFFDYRTAKECQWESDMVYTWFDDLKNDQQSMMGYFDALFGRDGWMNIKSESDLYEYQISVITEDKEGSYRTLRYTGFTYSNNLYRGLNMLSYPDKRAKQMHITLFCYDGQNVAVWDEYFTLKGHPYWNMAYYLASDLKPITPRFQNVSYCEGELPRDNDGYITKYNTLNNADTKTRYPNYIKTSEVNNPLYFPDANTYQVGNVEILALSSNTTDLSTGQVGDAPLYVFAQDGIYGLFVDSSGVMTYSNSRPLARDILNNPFSVTPTDFGVVFTTDRGLMMIAGSQVIEIGQSAEGKYLDFTNANSFDNLPVAASAIDHERLVQLNDYKTDCEFKEYLKGAIIGYNFNEYELWVTNPNKDYTYIFALNQKQWFKRSMSCTQYINNYPHLYILDNGKRVSDIDRETTSGNHCFFLTRPIKFDSQSFKQSYRSVVRGLFDLPELKRSSNYTTITLTGDKLKPDVRTIELIEQTKRSIAVEPFETEYRTIELQGVPLTPITVVDEEENYVTYGSIDELEIEHTIFFKHIIVDDEYAKNVITYEFTKGMYHFTFPKGYEGQTADDNLNLYLFITTTREYTAQEIYEMHNVFKIDKKDRPYKFIDTDQTTDPFTDGEVVFCWLQNDAADPNIDYSDAPTENDKRLIIYDSKITPSWSYDTFAANFGKYNKADGYIPVGIADSSDTDSDNYRQTCTYHTGECYTISNQITDAYWQVIPPKDMTITFRYLMSVIDTWQRWYYRDDDITLKGNECYSISYRVGNVTGDDGYIAQHSFKYIGVGAAETADTTVADIILALDTNDPDFAAMPSYYPETVELTSGEYIRIETTAGTTYEAHYTGGSGAVDTATLILDIANNKYTVQQTKDQEGVISNDVLTMTSGESVQFTDLDGNTYNFTYTGDNTITYENLLYNIKIAEKYAMLDDFGDTSISIVQNECIELIVKYASGTEEQYSFQYLDSKNPITLSQLLERINGGSASIGKIPTIDPLYKIYLPINKIISFTDVDGKEYFIKIIPRRKSKVAGFYVTYSELMQVLSKYDNPNDNEGRFYFYNNHYWYRVTSAVSGYRAGIYVFGSYDCRKWKFIGGNEVGDIDGRGSQVPNAIENINGEDNILFRDLGTLTERIDCKYFRICFVGQLLPESSIEYIDMSVESRLLGGKLR